VVHFGVHGVDRSEQVEGLVDEVAAEVEQRATAGGWGPSCRRSKRDSNRVI